MFCGVVHREAATNIWADDRLIADEPAWYQLAAPYWHTALPGSASVAGALTGVVDPLTSASRAGDTRGIAACVAAAAAGVVLLGLSRASVPIWIAAAMSVATVSSVSPVAPSLSITHALLALTAASLLLMGAVPAGRSWRQHLAFCALTVFGAAVHPAFVAFAAGVWVADTWKATRASRPRVLVIGGASICTALVVAAMMLDANIAAATPAPAAPTLPALALALLGRFPADLQPAASASLRDTIALISPMPALMWASFAAAAMVVTRAGWLETRSALGAVLVVLFASHTWVPDSGAAVVPATIAVLALVARALTWTWHQPSRGARGLAMAGAIGIAAAGFVAPRHAMGSDNARMRAFVDAAAEAATGTTWSAGRMATTRALLQHSPHLAERRTPFGPDMLRHTETSESMIVFVDEAQMTRLPRGLWTASRPLRYRRADTFLDAQPDTTWLALAFHGDVGGEFCHGLLDAVGVRAPNATQGVALAHLGRNGSGVAAAYGMEVPFGAPVEAFEQRAPARFEIDARQQPRVVINGATAAEAPDGIALGMYDAWRNQGRGFVFSRCDERALPEIEDRRLRAAHVVERDGDEVLPAVPAVASLPVEVPFDQRGTPWFGPGWHGVEAVPMRWTGAREAEVYVVSARSQSLRIRLQADVPGHAAGSPSLSVKWNGEPLGAAHEFSGEGEWVAPAARVHRGLNTMTIVVDELVSPAAGGGSSDTRLLGAAVSHLSFVPIQRATTPAP